MEAVLTLLATISLVAILVFLIVYANFSICPHCHRVIRNRDILRNHMSKGRHRILYRCPKCNCELDRE